MGLPIAEDPDKNRAPVLFSEIIESLGRLEDRIIKHSESILSENWESLSRFVVTEVY